MFSISALDFFILFATAFGLTYLVKRTNGLGDCFLKLRCLMGQQHEITTTEDGKVIDRVELPVPEHAPWPQKLIDCFWCTSTWLTTLILLAYYLTYKPVWTLIEPFIYLFAIVGLAGALYTEIRKE